MQIHFFTVKCTYTDSCDGVKCPDHKEVVTFQFIVQAAAKVKGLNIREIQVEGSPSGSTPKVVAKKSSDFCADGKIANLMDGDTNTKLTCSGTQTAGTVLFEIEASSAITAFKIIYDSPNYEPVLKVYRDGAAVIYPLGVTASSATTPAPYTATYTMIPLGKCE